MYRKSRQEEMSNLDEAQRTLRHRVLRPMVEIIVRRQFALSLAISSVLFLLSATSSSAQQINLSSAAAQMAVAIDNSKEKTVAVYDFVGPNAVLTPLGRQLADSFSDALAKSHPKFGVIGRKDVAESFPEARLAPATAADQGFMVWAALDMGWKAAITGSFTVKQNVVFLDVKASGTKMGDQIALVQTQIPLTDDLKQLIIPALPESDDSNLPTPGKAGYSTPQCIYCPNAVYNDVAQRAGVQGVVMLVVTVSLDGRASDIEVTKDLPGLTASAIQAVASWRFRPATDSSGDPAVVRAKVEVTFRPF
jgi:TonB family protein